MPRKLVSSREARRAKTQHQKPCSDCPWARTALNGWLGSPSIEEWLRMAHGETQIECHVFKGAQCAGAATYRANVGKRPRDPAQLLLTPDKELVFANPQEFVIHHQTKLEKVLSNGK